MAGRQDNSFFISFLTALIVSIGTSLVMYMVVLPRLAPLPLQQRAISKTVVVPPLVGLQMGQARSLLTSLRLRMSITDQQKHPSQPAGTILSHVPTSGSQLKPNAQVKVIISLGPSTATPKAPVKRPTAPMPAAGTVKVPKLVGVSLRTAKRLLKAAGLKVGTTRQGDDEDLGPYVILSQQPRAGTTAQPGSSVNLVVNRD